MAHSNSLVHKVREIMYVASRIWLWRTKHSEWKDAACFSLLLWSIWYLHLFMFLGESCELPLGANDILRLAWFTLYFSVLMATDELWSSSMTGWGCWCSIREMCGTEDVDIAYNHFKAFYQIFTTVDKQLSVDAWRRYWVCFRIIWLIYFAFRIFILWLYINSFLWRLAEGYLEISHEISCPSQYKLLFAFSFSCTHIWTKSVTLVWERFRV
jgi:hypothetical protein